MSVFKVKLNNNSQGQLDRNPSTASAGNLGDQFGTSKQRTVYILGPNRVNRLLSDGETDCNYWKRYAPISEGGQSTDENAILTIVSDDGSVYSDNVAENTYPVVWLPSTDGIVTAGETYSDTGMSLDIVTTYGGHAVFCEIQNLDTTSGADISVRLNGSTDATFTVVANSTQVFNAGDLTISSIAISNPNSGVTVDKVQVILSVKSICNS